MIAVREHVGLQRQERAARVDEVDAGQTVLGGDLLGPDVLLHRHREVGAALHGRVVGDEHHLAPLDDANPGHDACARRVPAVHPVRGQRRQLEERSAGVDDPVDPLAGQHLAALAVPGDRLFGAAGSDPRDLRLDLSGQRLVVGAVLLELRRAGPDLRLEHFGHGVSRGRRARREGNSRTSEFSIRRPRTR